MSIIFLFWIRKKSGMYTWQNIGVLQLHADPTVDSHSYVAHRAPRIQKKRKQKQNDLSMISKESLECLSL